MFKFELSKVKYEMYVGDVHYFKTRPFENLFFLRIPFNQKLVNEARKLKWYHDEYPFDLTKDYILVLKVRPEFQKSFDHFLRGEYSKMYTPQQLTQLRIPQIINGKINMIYCILTKHRLGIDHYKETIRKAYYEMVDDKGNIIKTGDPTNHIPDDPDEYDIPPRIRMEFLNSIGNEDFVKSICSLRNL